MITVKRGGYIVNKESKEDVTNLLPMMLFEPCEFDKITFDDLLQLFIKHSAVLWMLFPDLMGILGESSLPRLSPGIPLSYLEIWWDFQYSENKVYGNIVPAFHGIEVEPSGNTPYSLMYLAANQLLDLPIILGPLEISEMDYDEMKYTDVTYNKPEYNLASIIMAITEELAVFESAEERDASRKALNLAFEGYKQQ